jgi:hypothetical protein
MAHHNKQLQGNDRVFIQDRRKELKRKLKAAKKAESLYRNHSAFEEKIRSLELSITTLERWLQA